MPAVGKHDGTPRGVQDILQGGAGEIVAVEPVGSGGLVEFRGRVGQADQDMSGRQGVPGPGQFPYAGAEQQLP
jgi:hypothetical protein